MEGRQAEYITLTQATISGEKLDTWRMFDGEKSIMYDACELPSFIHELCQSTRGALMVYINRLSMYALDMVETLYKMGFSPVEGNPPIKKMKQGEYKYLISDELKVYNITLCDHKRAIAFVDLDNIISVTDTAAIIKAYKSNPTGDIHTDYAIAAYTAIKTLDNLVGTVKKPPITISGYSRRLWCKTCGYKDHRIMLLDANRQKLPCKETLETYCRKAYHGGLNIIRPSAASGVIDTPGKVLDVNSLYPYIMYTKNLPYGSGHYGEGKPTDDIIRDVNNGHIYIFLRISAKISLKPGGVPCVQLPRRDKKRFLFKRGWLETSRYYNIHDDQYVGDLQDIELTLTQTDFALMIRNYTVKDLVYINYVWFSTTTELFKDYISPLYSLKKQAKTEAERYTAKMLLNALSGNMARLPEYDNAILTVSEDGDIRIDTKKTLGGISYIYIGAAITSYARAYIINYGTQFGDRWLYSDTDSIHFIGDEVPETIRISDKMGDFKIEHEFDRAIYYKYKEYGMVIDGKADLTLAGVPRGCVKLLEAWASGQDYDFSKSDVIDPYMQSLTDIQVRALESMFKKEDTDETVLDHMVQDILSDKMDSLREALQSKGIDAIKNVDLPVMYRARSSSWECQLNPQFINLYDSDFLKIKKSGSR